MKFRRAAVLLALFFSLSGVAHVPGRPDAICRIVSAFATDSSGNRDAQLTAQFREIKNGANLNPRVFDLSDPYVKFKGKTRLGTDIPADRLTGFEKMVLELRKGDTVVFDGVEYVLGDFLGAGNANHVFRLANQPGVIRLPFLSGETGGESRHEKLFRETKVFKKALQGKLGAVKIKHEDPKGRFNVVQEVKGTEQGMEFLKSIATETLYGEEFVTNDRDLSEFVKKDLTPLERTKLESLMMLVRFNEVDGGKRPRVRFVYDARQYIWDLVSERWVLVDPC